MFLGASHTSHWLSYFVKLHKDAVAVCITTREHVKCWHYPFLSEREFYSDGMAGRATNLGVL